MIGQRLDDLKLRERYCANVIGVEQLAAVPPGNCQRQRGIGISRPRRPANRYVRLRCRFTPVLREQMLEPMVLRGEYFADQALDVGMAEVALIPDSEMIGKTVREIAFRTRFGLNIVGMKRDGKAMDGSVVDEPLQLGDILLVVGNWRQIALLAKRGRDFVVLNMPVEVDDARRPTARLRMRFSAWC